MMAIHLGSMGRVVAEFERALVRDAVRVREEGAEPGRVVEREDAREDARVDVRETER